jgi:hypothetical protein
MGVGEHHIPRWDQKASVIKMLIFKILNDSSRNFKISPKNLSTDEVRRVSWPG